MQPEHCDCENKDKRNSCPPSRWSLCDEDVLVCTTCETPPSAGMLETESSRTLYNREVGSSLLDEDGEIHESHYSTQRRAVREVLPVCMMQAELYDLLAAAKQCGSVVLTCPDDSDLSDDDTAPHHQGLDAPTHASMSIQPELIGKVGLHQLLGTAEKDLQTTGTTNDADYLQRNTLEEILRSRKFLQEGARKTRGLKPGARGSISCPDTKMLLILSLRANFKRCTTA